MSKNVSTGLAAKARRKKSKLYEGPIKSAYERYLRQKRENRKAMEMCSDT